MLLTYIDRVYSAWYEIIKFLEIYCTYIYNQMKYLPFAYKK
jgi:hypothetical protein